MKDLLKIIDRFVITGRGTVCNIFLDVIDSSLRKELINTLSTSS